MDNKLEIIDILDSMYPDAQCELNYTTPFELLIATIMSAQCTDVRVNIITEELFEEYNTPKDFAALTYEELEDMIRSCGMYHTKAKSIINTSRQLIEEYNSVVPDNKEELMKLPGVGLKTASVVLSNAFHVPALAVDTHVFRVSNRLGLADANTPEKTGQQLMKLIPKDRWVMSHHQLIFLGRRICNARKPKCDTCQLSTLCRYYNEASAG